MKELDFFLRKYGRETYISGENWTSRHFKAVVEPLRYKNKMYLYGSYNELGHYPEGFYLFIGPVVQVFDEIDDDSLVHTVDGKTYLIHHWEKVYVKNDPVYIWAVIKERVG